MKNYMAVASWLLVKSYSSLVTSFRRTRYDVKNNGVSSQTSKEGLKIHEQIPLSFWQATKGHHEMWGLHTGEDSYIL
jgi:hypothetical protein